MEEHIPEFIQDISFSFERGSLSGILSLPSSTTILVVFAHGSGSSRFSPRNRFVADRLNQAGLGTLLIDLLTNEEEARDAVTGEYRFDISLLASRLLAATDWVTSNPSTQKLRVAYFGASTGAAAALVAAAQKPDRIFAIVSRGGRPDLAGESLHRVMSPTLLIVGSRDELVIELNDEAARQLRAEHKILIVPGASHLFEEPGALEQVADLAADWFLSHADAGSKGGE